MCVVFCLKLRTHLLLLFYECTALILHDCCSFAIKSNKNHCKNLYIKQVKQERALQEQASTYLQLVCSACDLAEPRVREAAGAIQQIKLQVGSLTKAFFFS